MLQCACGAGTPAPRRGCRGSIVRVAAAAAGAPLPPRTSSSFASSSCGRWQTPPPLPPFGAVRLRRAAAPPPPCSTMLAGPLLPKPDHQSTLPPSRRMLSSRERNTCCGLAVRRPVRNGYGGRMISQRQTAGGSGRGSSGGGGTAPHQRLASPATEVQHPPHCAAPAGAAVAGPATGSGRVNDLSPRLSSHRGVAGLGQERGEESARSVLCYLPLPMQGTLPAQFWPGHMLGHVGPLHNPTAPGALFKGSFKRSGIK